MSKALVGTKVVKGQELGLGLELIGFWHPGVVKYSSLREAEVTGAQCYQQVVKITVPLH